MADLDLATRHRLADALAGADADTLREDARVALDIVKDVERASPAASAMMHRLAALALAEAERLEPSVKRPRLTLVPPDGSAA